MKKTSLLAVAIATLAAGIPAWAQQPLQLTGDIGAGVSHGLHIVRGDRHRTDAVPYLNFEYGRAFSRIDTLGVKTAAVGDGWLEVIAQWRGDGYAAAGLDRRHDSVPVGLGTLQITPYGGFGAAALYDMGKSGGSLVQLRYLAQWTFGPVVVYPELGVEAQSASYARYYFGTTEADARVLGRAYRPGSVINPYVGLLLETRLSAHWYLNAYLRGTALDRAVSRSPLVDRSHAVTGLAAIAYRF